MVLILGDEIRKAMKERGITVIGNLVFGWSSKDKVLVIAEKKKEFYEIYGVRVYISDGKMQRACVSETVRNVEEIGNRMVSVARNTADQCIEGYAIRDPHTSIHMLFTAEEGKAEIKQIPPIPETKQLPSYVNAIGYICDKNLQPTEMTISLMEELLLHHILITGMTGSGKTSIVMKIVSEVRKTGKPVLVVTPQPGPWKKVSGVHVLTDEDEELKDAVNLLDIRSFTRDVEETVKTLSSLVEFFSHSEETQQLKLLVVFDETHKLMAYDELTKILDSAARELRKYGVALIFISQSCFDFIRGIRGDIHTHIAMRTVWSNDLIYIKQHSNIPKGNDGFFEPLRHTSNGIGILYSHFFNHAVPYYCKFLEYDKLFQPLTNLVYESVESDEITRRRAMIVDILKGRPNIPAESIKKELEKKFEVDDRTLYRDLVFLEKGGLIRITSLGDKGRKYYGPRG